VAVSALGTIYAVCTAGNDSCSYESTWGDKASNGFHYSSSKADKLWFNKHLERSQNFHM